MVAQKLTLKLGPIEMYYPLDLLGRKLSYILSEFSALQGILRKFRGNLRNSGSAFQNLASKIELNSLRFSIRNIEFERGYLS